MGRNYLDFRPDKRQQRHLERAKRERALAAEAERLRTERFAQALALAIDAMYGGAPSAKFVRYRAMLLFFPRVGTSNVWRWVDITTGFSTIMIERVRPPPRMWPARLPYSITSLTSTEPMPRPAVPTNPREIN